MVFDDLFQRSVREAFAGKPDLRRRKKIAGKFFRENFFREIRGLGSGAAAISRSRCCDFDPVRTWWSMRRKKCNRQFRQPSGDENLESQVA